MAINATRVSGFDDGVTDRWYFPPTSVQHRRINVTAAGEVEALYYAFGNPRRTTHPLNDRFTTYPDLP